MTTPNMEIFEARLASFNITLPGNKRRASNAKSARNVGWPHKTPNPEQLAQAGFYYKPSPTSFDNTVCFMCDRKLDGWEEDDNPFVEHLKHSASCAWALVMSANIEDSSMDPTTTEMMDARRETFRGNWPHEGKRGWTCKTEKMVEAGWYYAPTPESDDFVTCAHCKLSLDGWEPKDNPFEEHHRRSPDCAFFSFAGTSAPKATRAKKGRSSKASRLSTQSVATVASEVPTIPDFEDSIDHSTLSQDTVMSTASKATIKAPKATKAKGKGKGSRSKKAEPVAVEEVPAPESQESSQPATTRGKKRTSEQISRDDNEKETATIEQPATKRRTTRSRSSVVPTVDYPDLSATAEEKVEAPPKPTRGGKKRASSQARKVSTASTASKASLRAGIPDDSAIEAELAAELEKPWSDNEMEVDEPVVSQPPAKKGKGKKAKTVASTASVRQAVESPEDSQQVEPSQEDNVPIESSMVEQEESKPKKKTKATKGKGKKKAAAKEEEPEMVEPEPAPVVVPTLPIPAAPEPEMADVQPVAIDVAEEGDTEMSVATKPKKGGKKKAAEKPAPKTKSRKQKEEVAEELEAEAEVEDDSQSLNDLLAAMPQPPTSTQKPAISPLRSIPGQFDTQEEASMAHHSPLVHITQEVDQVMSAGARTPISAQRTVQVTTPSPSPQSSDAENQPPSARPSAARPPLRPISPSKGNTMRIPLASTPKQSPSKLNRPIGGLTTSHPWRSIDVEMIFAQTPGAEKENILGGIDGSLTSPEKKMTVEEWISNIAQKCETQLKAECERIVGIFEKEGSRAMTTLEGIESVE